MYVFVGKKQHISNSPASSLKNLRLSGIMTTASLTNDDTGLLSPALAFIIISLCFLSGLERSSYDTDSVVYTILSLFRSHQVQLSSIIILFMMPD